MKNIVLDIPKKAISDSLYYENTLDAKKLTEENEWLKKDGASFVTLTHNGKLRGCIGSLIARRPLIEDIIENANNAAFRDPRFPKLTREEFNKTDIEVSILSEPELIEYINIEDLKRKITPHVHGVILTLKSNQATFLPQVWEELPEFETFFGHLLNKAGLAIDSFKEHPQIYTYQVDKFK